jgi:hypothetical protein
VDRNVTAIYRSYSVADLVRRDLEAIGISRSHIHVIPDADEPLGAGGYRDDTRWTNRIHDLHLPDDDVRLYQSSVRRGDYVVSANVDDDLVARVQQIMRRPEAEAYNLDVRADEFQDEQVVLHTDTARRAADARVVGQREVAADDPYVRSYRRKARLPDQT